MKKFILWTISILGILIGGLAVAPFLFKDKIKAIAQKELDKRLNAKLTLEDVDLSFLRSFPNASISLEGLKIVGQKEFLGDTLLDIEALHIAVNLKSVIQGNNYEIKKIALEKPKIHAIVLEDGMANWDIVKPDSAPSKTPKDTAQVAYQLKLESYSIEDGYIRYEDATMPMSLRIGNLNHSGKGDFTADIYDLITKTEAKDLTVEYDGTRYLNHAYIGGDLGLGINMATSMYKILSNQIKINELPLEFEGWVAMPNDDINMDLKYKTPGTDFKQIFSLVPGAYTKDFADVKTSGNLAFSGTVKGKYNATTYPAFTLNLKVGNGMFQYPSLPTAVNNINVDVSVENAQGSNFNNLKVDLRKAHADLGKNPVDAQAKIVGMGPMQVDGKVKANLNLGELTQMFPIEETTLKGQFLVDATANGRYDEAAQAFPKVNAKMNMTQGYVKNKAYPVELKNVTFDGTMLNENGALSQTTLDVPKFHIDLDNEPVDGNFKVNNFDDPNFIANLKGILDLEKIMKIYPIEGMKLSGKVNVENFSTQGKMSDIEKGNYAAVPTSGKATVQNVFYDDVAVGYPTTIRSGRVEFTPKDMLLSGVDGLVGKTDFQMDGNLSNYLGYGLLDEGVLGGDINLRSKKLNVNEWMGAEEDPNKVAQAPETSAPMEAIPVPANLAVNIHTAADQVIYDDLTLSAFKGTMTVANEALKMSNVTFKTLGGDFAMNGTYDSKNLRKPAYDFDLNILNLGIQDAFKYFNSIRAIAPIMEFISGKLNTNFKVSGEMDKNMNPILDNIVSFGKLEILSGILQKTPLTEQLVEKTKIQDFANFVLQDIRSQFEVKNGKLIVSPFDFKLRDILINVGGEQSLGGMLNYVMKIDAPKGRVGNAASAALGTLTGGAMQSTSDRIKADMMIGGTWKAPKIVGLKSAEAQQMKEQAIDLAKDKAEQLIKDKTGLNVNADSLKGNIKNQAQQQVNEIKNQAQQQVNEIKNQAQQQANEVKNEVKNEVQNQTNQVKNEVKNQVNDIKDKFGFPKKKNK